MTSVRPRDILDFWFAAGWDKWWTKSDAFDVEIKRRFGAIHAEACAGKLDDWMREAQGALALVILLDQFSRNLHRGDHRAWAQDAKALAVTREAIARRFDVEVPVMARSWFYMPFEHSEDLAVQMEGLPHFARLEDAELLKFVEEHAGIIRRFGRFPHRTPCSDAVRRRRKRTSLKRAGSRAEEISASARFLVGSFIELTHMLPSITSGRPS